MPAGLFDWRGRTVLVTGGTGSFGRAVLPALLERGVARAIVFSRDEVKHAEVLAAFRGLPVDVRMGDVRNAARCLEAFDGVDVVIHAAALKRVESCQYNWRETIETNVLGSTNVIMAARAAQVERVIALSTDKACAPVNTYGMTKALMEQAVVWGNSWVGRRPTRLACVRYGNVIGSRGSVVPLFESQRASGVVTVTDPAMTRFWMTLDQAVAFVLSSVEQMQGGEIFVPKLSASSIVDVAAAVAPGCEVRVVGARPGEKRHECMVSVDEAPQARDLGDRFAIYPASPTWPIEARGARLPEGFSYSSEWAPTLDLAELAQVPA